MKGFLKILYDFISDKNGDGDEKRVWGSVLIVSGLVKALFLGDVDGGNTLILTGGGFLGGAALADAIKPKI